MVVNRTNLIKVCFLKEKASALYIFKKPQEVDFYKDLLRKSKNAPAMKCDSTVEIFYFHNSSLLLTVYFSSSVTKSKYKSAGIIYKLNGSKITYPATYNVGMSLDERFYQLFRSRGE